MTQCALSPGASIVFMTSVNFSDKSYEFNCSLRSYSSSDKFETVENEYGSLLDRTTLVIAFFAQMLWSNYYYYTFLFFSRSCLNYVSCLFELQMKRSKPWCFLLLVDCMAQVSIEIVSLLFDRSQYATSGGSLLQRLKSLMEVSLY